MRILKGFLFFIAISSNQHVRADSDGVYCIGKDYVAIEARDMSLAAESPSIYLVTISSTGELNRHIISTPPNSNKSLKCEENRVLVSDGHVININDSTVLTYSAIAIEPNTKFSSLQFPYIDYPKSVLIPSSDNSHYYILVLSHNINTPEQGMSLHHLSARVVKTDKRGKFINSKLLAEGVRLSTIH